MRSDAVSPAADQERGQGHRIDAVKVGGSPQEVTLSQGKGVLETHPHEKAATEIRKLYAYIHACVQ